MIVRPWATSMSTWHNFAIISSGLEAPYTPDPVIAFTPPSTLRPFRITRLLLPPARRR